LEGRLVFRVFEASPTSKFASEWLSFSMIIISFPEGVLKTTMGRRAGPLLCDVEILNYKLLPD
jgi:hypothetical protein